VTVQVGELRDRGHLSFEHPFDGREVSCGWVAPVVLGDGAHAVLKLGMPHMEGTDELQGLRFWDGDPTVRLLDEDAGLNASSGSGCSQRAALETPGMTIR
jgi:hypothetical protein